MYCIAKITYASPEWSRLVRCHALHRTNGRKKPPYRTGPEWFQTFPELSLQNAKTQQRTNVWCETGSLLISVTIALARTTDPKDTYPTKSKTDYSHTKAEHQLHITMHFTSSELAEF